MHLVAGTQRAALIDTGMGIGDLRAVVGSLCDKPALVCNTHFHWDHSAGNHQFEQIAIHQSEAKLLARPQDMKSLREQMRQPQVRAILPPGYDVEQYGFVPTQPTLTLSDGELIDLGGRALRVLHTPGHSFGHVAYWDEPSGLLFSGDTAYRGPMYACFRGGDPAAFCASAQKLATLADRVRLLLPGHNGPFRAAPSCANWRAAGNALNRRVPLAPPTSSSAGKSKF
jgi:glyoxylase-like metal-dependent hydrolase (beta-lactamase superfamily II)